MELFSVGQIDAILRMRFFRVVSFAQSWLSFSQACEKPPAVTAERLEMNPRFFIVKAKTIDCLR